MSLRPEIACVNEKILACSLQAPQLPHSDAYTRVHVAARFLNPKIYNTNFAFESAAAASAAACARRPCRTRAVGFALHSTLLPF
jgi:hypothetical protein